ncbi:pPIWI_RE_Z domain-containing protein [Acaryochloris marina]|uniref:pPIWI-RE three-gene island domain-containing protein n=1 Tax=Acaryochloris marina (strain MBIC 11017) TaxID=329726 RepID=B0CDI9_ACAM1|nr:ATP-binding protein [Acaryochloris marina]ABW28058.1 hypothetical protein AM1_3062 [Acaryochloris marina MBIC11017]BDM82768.1 hypothetical protein AM10699_56290 [Acaryochloris marina MBIC10699]
MRVKPNFWTGPNQICWLCVLMESFVGSESLEHAPAVMSGMHSILNASALIEARQAIFNMRQMSLAYVTQRSVNHAIAIYNNHHYLKGTQGSYQIDAQNLTFERTNPLEDSLITQAKEILRAPLSYQPNTTKVAEVRQAMSVALGTDSTSTRIPIPPIEAKIAQRHYHPLNRQLQDNIRIPLEDLKVLAVKMDDREANYPERRPGRWASRLERFMLTVPTADGLQPTDTLTLAGIKHLIGLPGSGKTTILILIAMWLAQENYKAMFVFPSIEVSRQYMDVLQFHAVKVGMLVGQSDETRRRHADNLAEAIAAAYPNRGFSHTLGVADIFSLNCVLPAFSNADTSMWGFGYAPCNAVLQSDSKGELKPCLCPLWTMCGRNKSVRELTTSNIWVGHIRSMDTPVSSHAVQVRIRYFELIARTFDVVVFDEADMVQSNLDAYGAATLSISGSEKSIHRTIQEQIHSRFAGKDNHRLADPDIATFSWHLSDFGNHNSALVTTVQNLNESYIGEKYENQLLTVLKIVSEIVNENGQNRLNPEEKKPPTDEGRRLKVNRSRALTDFWETAAYNAFYNRTSSNRDEWKNLSFNAATLRISETELEEKRDTLIQHFQRYLAEGLAQRRDEISQEISQFYLSICFPDHSSTGKESDAIKLLIVVTFVILGYQRIIPGTRALVAEGLIRDPIIQSTASRSLRRMIPSSLLGSLSGVKYTFSKAQTTRTNARNVEISYVAFVGAPRMLMYRFHQLLSPDNNHRGPATLLTSATSFLEASPAYNVNIKPDYLLKPLEPLYKTEPSRYEFKWQADKEWRSQPLRYSGAGESRERNLKKMIEELVKGGTRNEDARQSEIYKSINNFDVRGGQKRKAALIVNSYEQARMVKTFLNRYYPETGRRTKAVVRFLKEGEKSDDYVTTGQCESLGDDDSCDIIVFPMLAIGRGVNIVFTKGPRMLDAAIGSIYFLTRPHPTSDDMQLLYSLAGQATQDFDSRTFGEEDVDAIANSWQQARKDLWRTANQLLREPIMASRLSPELFKAFTANQMVAILQTIGRGMRNGCPVAVYFVDAAWAMNSALGKPDSGRDSMLVQMRSILEDCINHPDPTDRSIYQELYGAFLEPLREIAGVKYPKEPQHLSDETPETDDFDSYSHFYEQ